MALRGLWPTSFGLVVALTLALGSGSSAKAQTTARAALRTEVPIRLVAQPNGAPTFVVPVSVGGQVIDSGLDTGSGGLRLLPRAQDGIRPTDVPNAVSFGSGVRALGPIASADVSVGGLAGTIDVQAVHDVSCGQNAPPCSIDTYGFFGDKRAGRGLPAIFGALPDGKPLNPLIQLGVRRWIIDLPRPGESQGTLILDPRDDELAGFRAVTPGSKPWQVQACVERRGPRPARVCGSMHLDSGAPGFQIVNAPTDGGWRPGTPFVVDMSATGGSAIRYLTRVGDKRQGTRFSIRGNAHREIVILSGVSVYYSYDVMWDQEHQQLLLRPRSPYPGGSTIL